MRELAKRLGGETNITTYSLHPGLVDTEIFRDSGELIQFGTIMKIIKRLFFLNLEMGAQTTLYCALEESIENESGQFYE